MVVAQGIVKRFGDFEAVRGIDLTVEPGTCFALLGPNGAGKSTTIRMICCLTPVTSGRLEVLGQPAHPGNRALKRELGVVSQEDYLDPSLTVKENVELHGRFYGLEFQQARMRAGEWLEFMQLGTKANAQVRTLSGGMRRRLVIARALMGSPRLLILDEPTTGLDPQARIVVWTKVRELLGRGVTVLLTTHYMDEAERLADQLVVIDQGRILRRGTAPDLIEGVVGRDCLEIPACAPHQTQWIASTLGEEAGSIERQGDTVLVFSNNMDGVIERLRQACLLPSPYYRRRASLEDVFLRLIGRDLRE